MEPPAAKEIYDQSIVIDGLNISNWDSPAVIARLQASGVACHQRNLGQLGELLRDHDRNHCLASKIC